MENEAYSFALKTTLNEMQTLCPEISNAFICKKNGEIIATDPLTPENAVVHAMNALDAIFGKTNSLGNVEGITLEGTKRNVNVSNINNLYLVTVATKKADMDYVNTVTRVLIPTVLKLLEKIDPIPIENPAKLPQIPEEHDQYPNLDRDIELPEEAHDKSEIQDAAETRLIPESEGSLQESSAEQFAVEDVNGLFASRGTVRIDEEVLCNWAETTGDKKVEDVEIVTFGGKTARCKVKRIEDSKYLGKGVVQMPGKMQLLLEVTKGELVKVKPVIQ